MMSSVRRLTVTGLALLCAAAGVLGALSAPAGAQFLHKYLSRLTEVPAGPGVLVSGPFAVPVGLATDASGDVYVADPGSSVVDEFSSSGNLVQQITSGHLEGQMEGSVAVNRVTGEVYVMDAAESAIEVFSATGEHLAKVSGAGLTPQGNFGNGDTLAVDAATDRLYVAPASEGYVDVLKLEPGSKMSYVTQLNKENVKTEFRELFEEITSIAVNEANGELVVSSGQRPPRVDVFKPKGASEYELSLEFLVGSSAGKGETYATAVEEANDYIYVAHYYSGAPETMEVWEYSSSGALMDEIGGGQFGGEEIHGLAVGAGGKLYVSGTLTKAVDVFGATLTLPDLTPTTPSPLHATDATLTATLNPNGQPVSSCVFEYGSTSAYGSTAPCAAGPGSGTSPVRVSSVEVTGLVPDSGYQFRVMATGEEGVTVYSTNESFETAPAPEGTPQASGITSFAATLTGVLGSGQFTPEYHFAYGPTSAYGSVWPTPNAKVGIGGQQTATQTITGLQPDTTYHYALVATDFGGGEEVGPDETFTTRPLVPPGIVTGGAVELTGTTAALNGAVNAEGLPTIYRFEYGTSTAYGSSWPSVQVYAGTGETSQSVTVTVPNLQPSTTYHYRLVATNEDGTTDGADQTFTTPGYPVSIVREPPVLTAQFGFVNPEAGKPSATGTSKSKGKAKKGKAKHRKAKNKKRHNRGVKKRGKA